MSPTYGGWGGRYVWRQPSTASRAPFWTQGGDSYPGPRQLARHGRRHRRQDATRRIRRRSGAGATAFQHDFAARMDWTIKDPREREPQPGGRRERPGGQGADHGRRACRHAADARRRAARAIPTATRSRYRWFFYPEAGTGIPGQPVVRRRSRADRRWRHAGEGGIPSGAGRRPARAAAARDAQDADTAARDGHAARRRAPRTSSSRSRTTARRP